MRPTGVLAIQGDFAKHLEALEQIEAEGIEVRTPEDLEKVERLIIPGGESTTTGLLLSRYGLGEAIRERAAQGMPVWGTCMGMILMASDVDARPIPFNLELLDITVKRNAFGAQVHSFEDQIQVIGLTEPIVAVFIRAPIVTRMGQGVETVSRYRDSVVAVRQGNALGTSFHPELTGDTRMHEWFLRFQS